MILVGVPVGAILYPQLIATWIFTFYCIKHNIDVYDALDDLLPEYFFDMPVVRTQPLYPKEFSLTPQASVRLRSPRDTI